jgi:hypothetical protein
MTPKNRKRKERSCWLWGLGAAVLASSILLHGCSSDLGTDEKDSNKDKSSTKKAKTFEKNGEDVKAAEEYARVGEALLSTPEGYAELSWSMFEKALKLDPENSKALLYRAMLRPTRVFRAYATKVEPILTKEEFAKLNESIKQIKSNGVPEFIDYILGNKENVEKWRSVEALQKDIFQELIIATQKSLNDLDQISNFKNLKVYSNWKNELGSICNVEGKSYQNSYDYKQEYTDYDPDTGDPIKVKKITTNHHANFYRDIECDYNTRKLSVYHIDKSDIRLIRADFMHALSGIAFAHSYSMNGAESIMRKIDKVRKQRLEELKERKEKGLIDQNEYWALKQSQLVSDKVLVETIKATGNASGFGELQRPALLKLASDYAARAYQIKVDVTEANPKICYPEDGKRPNRLQNLIKNICLSDHGKEEALARVSATDLPTEVYLGREKENKDNRVMILADSHALVESPIQDLKTLLPTRFDEKGMIVEEASSFPDPTFGGLFPNGDLIDKMLLVKGGL